MEPYGADETVEVGAMLFTLVDPVKGHEVAYNRWYERDHLYAGCMVGPWLFANRRWVATKELKNLRFPEGVDEDAAVTDPLDAGSYLATYFIHKGHEAEHFDWANKQVFELYANDRGFDEREHAHTALYFFTGAEQRDPEGVPSHIALDHPYAGLISIHIDRADGVDQKALAQWFSSEGRNLLFDDPANSSDSISGESPGSSDGNASTIDQVQNWRPIIPKGEQANAPMKLGTGPGTRQRSLQMLFLTGAPQDQIERVRSYAEALESAGIGTVRLVAPFIPTIPGTDTYTDQLW